METGDCCINQAMTIAVTDFQGEYQCLRDGGGTANSQRIAVEDARMAEYPDLCAWSRAPFYEFTRQALTGGGGLGMRVSRSRY